MALIDPRDWIDPGRALDLAEELRRRAEAAGPPPSVGRMAPRPRAAFDRVMDALARLPRPVAVLGSLALLGTAIAAPAWFEGRMDALSRVPEGLWWIIGAVLSLHFGARFQAKAQEFEREVVEAVVTAPAAPAPAPDAAPEPAPEPQPEPEPAPEAPAAASPEGDAALTLGTLATGPNAALDDWRAQAA